jgi:hypothetical protein
VQQIGIVRLKSTARLSESIQMSQDTAHPHVAAMTVEPLIHLRFEMLSDLMCIIDLT